MDRRLLEGEGGGDAIAGCCLPAGLVVEEVGEGRNLAEMDGGAAMVDCRPLAVELDVGDEVRVDCRLLVVEEVGAGAIVDCRLLVDNGCGDGVTNRLVDLVVLDGATGLLVPFAVFTELDLVFLSNPNDRGEISPGGE